MVQRTLLVLLHNHRTYHNRNAESGYDADQDESHFPLFDKRYNECGEEHGDGVNAQRYFFGYSI